MSLPLRDIRSKVSVEDDVTLEAWSRATGQDKSEIIRQLVHDWASKQRRAARMLDAMLKVEGVSGSSGD